MANSENAYGSEHVRVADALNNLGTIYLYQGRLADAETFLRRSIEIRQARLGPKHPSMSSAVYSLAALYQTQGRTAAALQVIRELGQGGVAESRMHVLILRDAVNSAIVAKPDALSESYQVIQRMWSSAASAAIAQLSARFAAGDSELARLIRQDQDLATENPVLDKILVEASAKEPVNRDAANEQRIRDRLQKIASDRKQVQEAVRDRFPNFAALYQPPSLSIADTQALISEDEAVIFLDIAEHSYAWIVTNDHPDWLELDVSAKQIEAEVKTLRLSLTNTNEVPFDAQTAYALYKSTLGVFADKLASKKRLSIVTNGALTSIPLQLLVTQDPTSKPLKDVDWLVRSYAITVLPSVASLKTLRQVSSISSATKPMIAFADPVFSKSAKFEAKQQVALRGLASFAKGTQIDTLSLAEHLPQIPGTRDEVEGIAKVLGVTPGNLIMGLDATETAVKTAKLDQYRIVYFATHGLVAGALENFAKAKIEPSLAFTMPDKPTEIDDGLLSASEVAQLKLNADWVVLSACNTAAEEKPGAEALSGLARAFFYAGARSLLVSHWDVDDQATVELMTRLFQLTKKNPKLSHAEALQQSMLAMIDNAATDEDAHPRLWAPFVVVGEPAKPN